MPVGSEVQGIAIPCYQNHRISALLRAKTLVIASRSVARMDTISTQLYEEGEPTTALRLQKADYNFSTNLVSSAYPVLAEDARFRLFGQGIDYNTKKKQGFIRGPVDTAIHQSRLEAPPEQGSSEANVPADNSPKNATESEPKQGKQEPLPSSPHVSPSSQTPPDAPWLREQQEGASRLLRDVQTQQADAQAVVRTLGNIASGSSAPETSTPNTPEETVAVCDGGLLFDSANARLTYLSNVRLRNVRLSLDVTDTLHIQLEKKELRETGDKAKSVATGTPEPECKSPAAETPSAAPSAAPVPSAPGRKEQKTAPIFVQADNAVVDSTRNFLYLEGRVIVLDDEKYRLTVTTDQSAYALADDNGNLQISGDSLSMSWKEEDGSISTLLNRSGKAYFNQNANALYLPGQSTLTRAGETLSCEESLCITLLPQENQENQERKKGGDFPGQLANLRFRGIACATARGHVVVTRQALGDTPSGEARGDTLVYNALQKSLSLTGKNCALQYGSNKLSVNGAIRLLPNGNIIAQGDVIAGEYERLSPESKTPLKGSYTAQREIRFDNREGVISTENGLRAGDEEACFSCEGSLKIKLLASPSPEKAQISENIMLNLGIMNYSEGVESIEAEKQVRAHLLPQSDTPSGGELSGDYALIGLHLGTLQLFSTPGNAAKVAYNGHRLEAFSANKASEIILDEQGNITATGDALHAEIIGEQGSVTTNCREALKLRRNEDMLEIGPDADIRSKDGIFTARAATQALLAKSPTPEAAPTRYPHLHFPYTGIAQASTPRGGSVQTAQGSMQCLGPIELEMDNERSGATSSDSSFANLRQATASDSVQIAAKDSRGKLIRAAGDHLFINGKTGEKRLSGKRVSLEDEDNIHIAGGKGASIIIDARNNVQINGQKQMTRATRIHNQIDRNKQKKN